MDDRTFRYLRLGLGAFLGGLSLLTSLRFLNRWTLLASAALAGALVGLEYYTEEVAE